ncbi:MAG TPA: TraR/DksA family transcriptional regulator [Phycisphaerae bacterium]|nr:TraR/DksA family transcriptional regulator [Phycisphaerae bacterium]
MATPRKTQPKKATPSGEASGTKGGTRAGGAKRPPQDAQQRAKAKAIVKKKVKTKPKTVSSGEGHPVASTKSVVRSALTERESKKSVAAKAAPKKLSIDPEFLKQIREALVHQRQMLLSVVQSTQAQMAEKTKDLPDVSDQASEGYGDELAVGLMAIEAAQLEDIEAAISRIDHGTYGLCVDCEKPIPRKRLEVLPFARRCLSCEGVREHRIRTQATYSEEEEEH